MIRRAGQWVATTASGALFVFIVMLVSAGAPGEIVKLAIRPPYISTAVQVYPASDPICRRAIGQYHEDKWCVVETREALRSGSGIGFVDVISSETGEKLCGDHYHLNFSPAIGTFVMWLSAYANEPGCDPQEPFVVRSRREVVEPMPEAFPIVRPTWVIRSPISAEVQP